jgi:hypothetical protein
MADETPEVPVEEGAPVAAPAPAPRRKWWPIPLRIWLKYLLGLPLGFVAALALAVLVLDSSIGHRLLADLLAQITFDNGLKVEIAGSRARSMAMRGCRAWCCAIRAACSCVFLRWNSTGARSTSGSAGWISAVWRSGAAR